MTKVEYMRIIGSKLKDKDGLIDPEKLNIYGNGGWELILFTYLEKQIHYAIFMRKSYQRKTT